MKNIAVIEAATTGAGFYIFDSAIKLGVNVTFFCKNLKTYLPLGIQTYIDKGLKIIEVDTNDYTSVAEKISAEYATKKLDGIVCLNDRCIEIAAKLAEAYNLPFINPDAVAICRNKNFTWELCSKLNIRAPKTWVIESEQQILEIAEKIGYPVILKSSRGTGSGEVVLCYNEADVKLHHAELEEKARVMRGKLMVQEYAKGPVVSVEAITHQGNTRILGITDRIMGTTPYFVEISVTFPVDLGNSITQQLTHMTEQLIRGMNITNGIIHAEFILSQEGPTLIEVNPRLGGGMIGKMISHAFDFDLYESIIQLSLGNTPNIPEHPTKAITEYLLYPSQAGTINAIKGIEIASNYPGILSLTQNTNAGEDVSLPKDYRSKIIATIISDGDTAAHSIANCFAAISNIVVEYKTS